MTPRLRDLQACFEGVIPSIIATAAADGTPNISYLSHVAFVDDDHVALSNQFFSKTAENIRTNPVVAILVVDARDGRQFCFGAVFERSLDGGPLFEEMASHLRAASAQLGMADVMRLRGVDIFRVTSTRRIPSPDHRPDPAPATGSPLAATADLVQRLSAETEVDAVIDTILDGLRDSLGHANAMILLKDPLAERLVAIGSRGYETTGVGAEVAIGEGAIGIAAAERRPIRVSDMSRLRRIGAAIRASEAEENRTRSISLPGLPNAMSQLALPMIAQGRLRGVLLAESTARLAFSREDQAALAIVAAQGGAALALAEEEASEPPPPQTAGAGNHLPAGLAFRVVHHAYDDSVFIDSQYLIKGVAGRLLLHLLKLHRQEGRTDFNNREIRLWSGLRLPDFKDNLETRLLLLRRRLDDKNAPVRIARIGRGRIRLLLSGPPVLDDAIS
ncbi:hypothetical protein LMIY3S_03329 [Labrys miyagiensis]